MHWLLAVTILAVPPVSTQASTTKADRLTAYIVKRQPKAKPYATRLARAIITQSKRVGLDPAALAALAWVESRYRVEAVGPVGSRGIFQLRASDARMAASWARLRPMASPWHRLSLEAIREVFRDVETSTYLAADELAGVVAWCRRARHRVQRWQVGDQLGRRRHRYHIDRLGHHQTGPRWPKRSYLRSLRYTYKQIKRHLNAR